MRLILTSIYLIASILGFTQQSNRANIWYFGRNAGLDFNSSIPRSLTDGQIVTDEGTAAISDDSGSLLFYTDGETIWNRNHEIMTNGEGLKGSFTSTQSALIVPRPGNDRYYYVFTTAAQGGEDGFNYSIVDMNLDGGLGAVTEKNIQLYSPTTEKLTAVHHRNGIDIWVITHRWESDEFYVYSVNENGLDESPIVSATGSRHEFNIGNSIGQMKVSTNGGLIALNLFNNLVTEIFSFDTETGTVEFQNQFEIQTSIPGQAIFKISGLEISPNERYVYISEEAPSGFPGQKIYQLDLASGTQKEAATVQIGGFLQIGPTNEIFCVNADEQDLLVIERPNLSSDDPEFSTRIVNISPGTNVLGLPNFIQSYFRSEDPVVLIPNVFTPNNDGINELFAPITFEHVETFQLRIFDRNGALIFKTEKEQNWWNGGGYPVGVYYWQLEYQGVNGTSSIAKGWVQLFK